MTSALLRRYLRCLRASAPCGSVRVIRRNPSAGLLGEAVLHASGHATIYLRPDLGQDLTYWILIHEWAHVLAWRRHGTEIENHGHEWGIAHADALQAVEREWARRGW